MEGASVFFLGCGEQTLQVAHAQDILRVLATGAGGGDCDLAYSTNGGGAWTFASILFPDTITLSPSQNLSQLQVRACAIGYTDITDPGTGILTGYDIRTEGLLAGVPFFVQTGGL